MEQERGTQGCVPNLSILFLFIRADRVEETPMALEKELETFTRELPRLLAEGHKGKHALVHQDQVDSVWPSLTEALDAGYNRFGLEAFLVKEVTDHEEPRFASRNVSRCR
jgi:hypothetical protein